MARLAEVTAPGKGRGDPRGEPGEALSRREAVYFWSAVQYILICPLLTMFFDIYHIIPANCRRDFSAGGETLGAA